MKVILLSDIPKIGKKYEIKEVADGYARNFLIVQNMAKPVNKENLAWLEKILENKEKIAEKELKEIEALASKIDGQEIEIKVKQGKEGQLFESINSKKIMKELKDKGYDTGKFSIELEEPIKEVGEYNIKLSFRENLEAEIKLIITAED